jgi:hypothetical protein
LLVQTVVRDDDRICAVMMARRHPVSGKVIWVTLLNGAVHTQQQDQAIRACRGSMLTPVAVYQEDFAG